MAQCNGCGRLLGLKAELECPCWLSVTEKGIVPARIVAQTKRARSMREKHK